MKRYLPQLVVEALTGSRAVETGSVGELSQSMSDRTGVGWG
ncbi:hypothetical protein [Streptomyces levis]